MDLDPDQHNGHLPHRGPVELTVVVPAFNEADRLAEGLHRLAEVLGTAQSDGAVEVLVVDDGSADGTADRALALTGLFDRARVIRQPANAGKGAAVRTGVAAARGARVAFIDADMSIDPAQLGQLVSALDRADVAIGSRAGEDHAVDYDNVARTTMGRAFNRLVNAVTGVGLADTQCGFKAFRTPVARLLFHLGVINRFAFDVEILFRARRLGLSIAEVPVQWRHMADSRVRPLSDPLSMLGDVLRARVGAPTPPAVQAVTLAPGTDPSALASVPGLPGRHLPLVGGPGERLLLFPLLGPAQVAPLADAVADRLDGAVTGRRTVTAAQLEGRAPLWVLDLGFDLGIEQRLRPASPLAGPR